MARVHFVKKARKARKAEGIKKGESYYWWAFRRGRTSWKRFSKEPPRRSQTTQSEYYAAMYDVEDDYAAIDHGDARHAAEAVREIASRVSEMRDEINDKISNLENAFPNGCPTLELLQERIESLDALESNLEGVADDLDSLAGDHDSAVEETLGNADWSY